MQASTGFEKFITGGLINTGHVSGVLLLTRQGQTMYSFGDLQHLPQEEVKQFLSLFERYSSEGLANKDFHISPPKRRGWIFKTYQRTFSSVYATCSRDSGGLTVCNLPYGILICVYGPTTLPGEAIKAIENFCDVMRR
ncbi:uncharacterized protein LOC128222307 [Mya arenaria]|uniref:uncharacterized protein LOC128209010 n=1 Tax=Mya arenaria TaxID=6604 RepID=UPI0022E54FB2|nr:uncharacterized protein LOC128209010 [Mya arenaria]XP_052787239.1 uncharacterized protein LOC128222307 [Mya arenaria]